MQLESFLGTVNEALNAKSGKYARVKTFAVVDEVQVHYSATVEASRAIFLFFVVGLAVAWVRSHPNHAPWVVGPAPLDRQGRKEHVHAGGRQVGQYRGFRSARYGFVVDSIGLSPSLEPDLAID